MLWRFPGTGPDHRLTCLKFDLTPTDTSETRSFERAIKEFKNGVDVKLKLAMDLKPSSSATSGSSSGPSSFTSLSRPGAALRTFGLTAIQYGYLNGNVVEPTPVSADAYLRRLHSTLSSFSIKQIPALNVCCVAGVDETPLTEKLDARRKDESVPLVMVAGIINGTPKFVNARGRVPIPLASSTLEPTVSRSQWDKLALSTGWRDAPKWINCRLLLMIAICHQTAAGELQVLRGSLIVLGPGYIPIDSNLEAFAHSNLLHSGYRFIKPVISTPDCSVKVDMIVYNVATPHAIEADGGLGDEYERRLVVKLDVIRQNTPFNVGRFNLATPEGKFSDRGRPFVLPPIDDRAFLVNRAMVSGLSTGMKVSRRVIVAANRRLIAMGLDEL